MALSILILSFLLRYVQPAIASISELDVRQASADSSNSRSLRSIISGCFATILACTWISVHSNIPAPTDSALQVLGRRLAIMFNLLIAPEFVITWTARQYIASREIYRRHKARGWTKTHAFFVIMGGFSLYENGELVRTLDIFELEKLEEEGKVDWPIITEEEIKDKSKGDYFSKGVVVLQTCWFIAQVIARGAEHMVVTELEVVTLAFSALTMIIYFLWWNKPLDVGVSVPVHLKNGFSILSEAASTTADDTLAIDNTLAADSTPTADGPPTADETPTADGTPTTEGIPTTDDAGPYESTDQVERLESQENDDARPIFSPEDQPLVSSPQDIEMQPLPLESRKNSQSTRRSSQHDSVTIRSAAKSSKSVDAVEEYTYRQMWTDTIEAFRDIFKKHNFIIAIFLTIIGVLVGIVAFAFYLLWKPLQEFVVAISDMMTCKKLNKKHPTRVPTFYCPKSQDEDTIYVIAIGVGVVFGSIHCIAWSFPFPSFTELWLWRITSILVTVAPMAVLVVFGFVSILLKGDDDDDSENVSNIAVWVTMIGMMFAIILLVVLVLAYIGARFCLLVLPLYALRALPEGAYDDVDWTVFLPHIHI